MNNMKNEQDPLTGTEIKVYANTSGSKKDMHPKTKLLFLSVGLGLGFLIPALACDLSGPEHDPDSPEHEIEARKTQAAFKPEQTGPTGEQIKQAEKEVLVTADASMYGSE